MFLPVGNNLYVRLMLAVCLGLQNRRNPVAFWLTLDKSLRALHIISSVVGLLTTQVTCARFYCGEGLLFA